jgi:hypothetical protein
MTFDATKRSRLKHHGRKTVVQKRDQRAQVQDLESRWKLFYWDYVINDFVGSFTPSIIRRMSGRDRRTVGFTACFLGSFTPTAGFHVDRLRIDAAG